VNFDIIIEEELSLARERIKSRVTQLLLGGGVTPAPSAPAAKLHIPEKLRNGPAPTQKLSFAERDNIILAYLKEHPGAYGRDIAALFPGDGMGHYKAAMVRLSSTGAIAKRGTTTQMTYWLPGQSIPKSPTPPGPEVKVLSNGRTAPASIDTRKKRDEIFMKVLAANPKGVTTGELIAAVRHLGFSLGANQSAVHRLVEDPRVSMKKNAAGERIHKLK
jgi:hypothetical protein